MSLKVPALLVRACSADIALVIMSSSSEETIGMSNSNSANVGDTSHTEITIAAKYPGYRKPCNGCGLCCISEICIVGVAIIEATIGKKLAADENISLAPCPLLVYDKDAGRVWCRIGLSNTDADKPDDVANELGKRIGFGVGCDAEPDAEEMNNADNLYINADGFIKHKSL